MGGQHSSAAEPGGRPPAPARARATLPLRGGPSELPAMKRALTRAPLGPKATLALTHAVLALEDELSHEAAHGSLAPPAHPTPLG